MLTSVKSGLHWFLDREEHERQEVEIWHKPYFKISEIQTNDLEIEFESCKPDMVLATKSSAFQSPQKLYGITVDKNGQLEVVKLEDNDPRTRLSVIDLKMGYSVRPNHSEAGYYAFTIARFIKEHGYENSFIVCAAGILPLAGQKIIQSLTTEIQDVYEMIVAAVSWIDLSVWMSRLNEFIASTLPGVIDLTWETAEWSIEINRCNGCPCLKIFDESSHKSCHQESVEQLRLELIPGLSENFINGLLTKDITNLKKVEHLTLNQLGPTDDPVYREVWSYGFKRLKALAYSIREMLESGDRPVPIPAGNYKSISIPIKDQTLKEYVLVIEFDSSSHRLAAVGVNRVGEGELLFYEEIHLLKEKHQVLPTAKQEIGLLRKLASFIKEVKQESEKTHFYVWSRREQSYVRELLERYNDYIGEFSELASLFIAPSHFHPPHYIQSQFVQKTNIVASPVTVLDGEVKRAFCLPTLYAFSIFEIGDLFSIPYDQFKTEEYVDFVNILSDAIPAAGVHRFWQEAGKTADLPFKSRVKELALHKLDVLNTCLMEMRRKLNSSFTREAFNSFHLDYSHRYPTNLAKEAHAWLLQSALNFCMDAHKVLKAWELPHTERVAKGKSALLKLISSEEWGEIYDANPEEWERKKFKRHYEEGTFVFEYHNLSTDFDVREGKKGGNWTLAPSGLALDLLNLDPPGQKIYHSKLKHLRDGYEYYYDLMSCQVERYRDGYVVLRLWSKQDPTLRKGYRKGNWDERKKAFWNSQVQETKFTLEKMSFDTLVNRLEDALPLLFPGTVNFKDLQEQLINTGEKLKDKLGKNKEKRKLKDCCSHLVEDLPPLTSLISIEEVRNFKETIEDFYKTAEKLKSKLNDDEKNTVNTIEEIARRIHLYANFTATTPSGAERGVSKLYTHCAQYMLVPPTGMHVDLLAKQEEINNSIALLKEVTDGGLTKYQAGAIKEFFSNYVSILLGPPGSGKSYTLRKFLELWLQLYPDQKALISACNNSVVDGLYEDLPIDVQNVAKRIDNVYDMRASDYEQYRIFATTPQKVWKLYSEKATGWKLGVHSFDLVVIDEAGQMPPAQALLVMAAIREGARIVLAGDDLQLPPIHQYMHPDGLEHYVSSIYSYYKNVYNIEPYMLKESFRSHPDIVNFLAKIGYPLFKPQKTRQERTLAFAKDANSFYNTYTNSAITVIVDKDTKSDKLNFTQANETIEIVKKLWEAQLKNDKGTVYDLIAFFQQGVAIIAPFRVQYLAIQRQLMNWARELCDTVGELFREEIAGAIRSAVDTVHSFQGNERDVIVVTLPTGLKESINDDHLLNPHLLNVAISRARKKVILFCTTNALNWSKTTEEDQPSLFENPYVLRELVEYCKDGKQVVSDTRTIYHYPTEIV